MSAEIFSRQRLEAFSDGVFAIVITLLVLELHIPELAGARGGLHVARCSPELWQGLIALLPKFISFIVSFVYISIYWINHHQLFHLLKGANRGLFWLNCLFLMCLTFIPFPTALIGSYPGESTAVVFYGLAMFCTAVSFVVMKCYILSNGQLMDKSESESSPAYLIIGPLFYVAAILLALIDVRLALAIYLLIPGIYIFAKIPTSPKA